MENMRVIARAVSSVMLALLLSAGLPVYAASVQWALQGVQFNDGGTASGTFSYDADTNTYSSINVTTTGGSVLGGQSFAGLVTDVGSDATRLGMAPFPIGTVVGLPVFLIRFGTALTNAGGTASLTLGSYNPLFPAQGSYEAVCVQSGICGSPIPLSNIRLVTAGSVVAQVVPVPAAVWLFGSALGVMGLMRRKLSR
jgi:hypothetical protein